MEGDAYSPQPILELASAFMQSRALLTACELDLFTVVGEQGGSSAAVAQQLRADARATDRLMSVLCTLRLLTKAAGIYRNTPLAARFLVRESPAYMGGLMHWAHLWESWGTLTAAVRQGGFHPDPPRGRS